MMIIIIIIIIIIIVIIIIIITTTLIIGICFHECCAISALFSTQVTVAKFKGGESLCLPQLIR